MQQIWFITGSSRGLGRAIARAALDAGDLVAATARRPAQLEQLVTEYGERIHPIALDVTDARAAHLAVADARGHFGRLDVIVNNAGYADVSPIEIADHEDFRAQFDINFWGVYNRHQSGDPGPSRTTGWPRHADFVGERTRRRVAGDRLVPGRQIRDRRPQPGSARRIQHRSA
jgi:NAD(P)-dependent dehydrogenase (short-subunit alcohol dehydrogenase family)